MNASDLRRFNEKVRKTDGCWLWTASVVSDGYGQMWLGRTMVRAHRLSYEIHKGPVPKGLFVCHRCDVPRCVNPDHLFVGTNQDNQRDSASKGRTRNANPSKTHCMRGHEFSPENTRVVAGKRYCKTCQVARNKTYRKDIV